MTNKEKMKRIIEKDYDKNSNYNKIINKIENSPNKKTYFKYAVVPIILVIALSILLNKQSDSKVRSFKDENSVDVSTTQKNIDYNGLETYVNKSIIVNELKNYQLKDDNSINYLNNINIPYFEALKDIKIPDDFNILADGHGVCVSKDIKDKDYGKINNYELWYKNSKNKRRIIIALSDKNMPYRDFRINRKNINKTVINGIEVEIYKYKNMYISIFSYNGYNFDIESCDIMEEEYTKLLYSIIK